MLLKPQRDLTSHWRDRADARTQKAPLDPASLEAFKEEAVCKQFLSDPVAQHAVENTLILSQVSAGGHHRKVARMLISCHCWDTAWGFALRCHLLVSSERSPSSFATMLRQADAQ